MSDSLCSPKSTPRPSGITFRADLSNMASQRAASHFEIVFTAEVTVSRVGSAVFNSLGWTAEQACEQGMGLVHPEDRLAFGAMLKVLRTRTGSASIDARFSTADGDWKSSRVVATNRLNDAGVAGIVLKVAIDEGNDATPEQAGNGSGDSFDSTTEQDTLDPSEPSDIGILLRERSSVIDLVTGPAQAKLGCHPDALAGLHIWEIVHGDDESDFSKALDAMETKPAGETCEYGPVRFVDMSGFEKEFVVVILRKSQGLVVRARDLSSRAPAESSATEPDSAVVLLDANFVVTYASESFEQLIGRPPTSAVGLELLAAVHPTDRRYAKRRFGVPALDNEIHSFLRVRTGPDGAENQAWRWIEVVGRNYLDDSTVGQIALCITAVGRGRDIELAADTAGSNAERGTFSRDSEGRVGFVNDELLNMVGSENADELAERWPSLTEAARGKSDGIAEFIQADGSVRHLRCRMQPVIGTDGVCTGDVGVVEDVTRFVETGDLPDPAQDDVGSIIVLDRAVGIAYLAEELCELVGSETRPIDLRDVFTAKSAVLAKTEIWVGLVETRAWTGQLWLKAASGEAVPFHAQLHLADGAEQDPLLASGILTPVDGFDRWAPVDQAGVDPETALLSGAALQRRIERALASRVGMQQKVVLALIAIDGFEALRRANPDDVSLVVTMIADRLTSACRHDESAARIEAGTFAVFSQRLGDSIDLEHLVDRISDALAPPIVVNGSEQPVFLSVGVVQSGAELVTADQLLSNADLGLRRAQDRGRTRIEVVDEYRIGREQDRRILEAEFREALAADEIDNVYQPIVPANGDVRALRFEALVRWNSPVRGILGAADILRVADDLELSGALGHRVADRALAFVSTAQHRHGVDVEVHVNVSASQLRERGFVSRLDALLGLYDVDPARLGVEITETTFLNQNKEVEFALRQLHDIGVRVIIDDATGRVQGSSQSQLREMKIDRRLVESIGRDSADTARLAAILTRAKSDDLAVTAVGVATGRQLDLVVDLGFDWLQGFLLERPRSSEEVIAAFSSRRSETKSNPVIDIDVA